MTKLNFFVYDASELQFQSIKDRLRKGGYRVTGSRLLIWEILRREGHLGADELYRRAKQKYPGISISTIYRGLKTFKKLGLIDELHFNEEHHHYENKTTEHHHLTCLKCGTVFEFLSPHIQEMKKEISSQSGFKITSAEITLSGYCPKCQ